MWIGFLQETTKRTRSLFQPFRAEKEFPGKMALGTLSYVILYTTERLINAHATNMF